MPGASGLCKNRDCVNPRTGQRRQMACGCNGYCRTCARTFAATAAADARAREYAGKEKCTRCRVALAQITDPVTGGRYCKLCAKQPDLGAYCPDTCAYCRSRNAAVSAAACTWTRGCQRPALMCERCAALHGARVCDHCWRSEWRSACFACSTALPTTQTWAGRFCHGCFMTHFGDGDAGELPGNDLRCFYCKTDAASVSTRACAHSPGCPGQANTCGRCADLHGQVVCSA